jgi:hypothetical protein
MIKIKIYDQGYVTEYHVPKKYKEQLEKLPLHELIKFLQEEDKKGKTHYEVLDPK